MGMGKMMVNDHRLVKRLRLRPYVTLRCADSSGL